MAESVRSRRPLTSAVTPPPPPEPASTYPPPLADTAKLSSRSTSPPPPSYAHQPPTHKQSLSGGATGKHHPGQVTFWQKCGGGLDVSKGESRILVGLTLLASVVRFWKIDRPSSVVFDEVHFGGFANKYMQSRFFMDVHPPLAKLLITLMAFVSGFEGGSFDFKEIGREYGEAHVPYVPMRMLPATLGLLLVPLTYLTLRALQTRPTTALLGALFITFENGLITQSRFILLDSPLIFFTALTTFFWVGFANEDAVQRDRRGTVGPFSRRWWVWLTLTGLGLGAVVSCKWVGLFTIATVGVLTIVQLWGLLGDLRVPIRLLVRHFVARALCLIAVPAMFYTLMFGIHFAILDNSGEGDGFMSSEFQHTLKGHGMEDTFADVMVGSRISIRHVNTQGGYLHSHPHNYPGGSKQQQITLYPHRDENNVWLIGNHSKHADILDPETHEPPSYINNHHLIVLDHILTNKKLHSHDLRPQVTEVDYQNEVSAYGFEGFEGDANDHWQVEIDADSTDTSRGGKDAKNRLVTLRSKFRLRHLLTGCYLFSHKVKLPDWGYEQQEVTCNKNPSKANSLWYVETNTHRALPPNSKKVNYRRPGFFAKFLELQAVMWRTNAGLTDRHAYDSRPEAWPILKRGINFWVKDHRQIYLIGNPLIWWASTVSVLIYGAVRVLLILRAQRGYKDHRHTKVVYYDQLCGFLVLGWALHYFPFFLMQRQLFLHHYFPALYFAILQLACLFDLATAALKPRIRLQVALVVAVGVISMYYHFSSLAYAGTWTKSACERSKWLQDWDFSCNDFHSTYAEYAPHASSTPDPWAQALKDQKHKEAIRNDGNAQAVEASPSALVDVVEPGRLAFKDEHHASNVPKSDEIPMPQAMKDAMHNAAEDADDKDLTSAIPAGPAKEPGAGEVALPAMHDATNAPEIAPLVHQERQAAEAVEREALAKAKEDPAKALHFEKEDEPLGAEEAWLNQAPARDSDEEEDGDAELE